MGVVLDGFFNCFAMIFDMILANGMGMVWEWYGNGLGMVWEWFGNGLGMVWVC